MKCPFESESQVAQSYPILCDPMDCSPPAPLFMGFSRQEYWSGLPYPSLGHLPNPGTELRSPTLQSDSLPSEPPGNPQIESRSVMSNSLRTNELYSPWNSLGQNTGVGYLSLLQGIFPTQGLKPGLLHCRRILYQLSHKGSPEMPFKGH